MRRILVTLALLGVLSGCGSSAGDGSAATTSQVEEVVTTTTEMATTTTKAPATTTTVAPAELYDELNAEIQRACDEAFESGHAVDPDFDRRWAAVSSAAALQKTTEHCVAERKAAAAPPPTTAPPTTAPPTTIAPAPVATTYYENCDAARAAGAAPLYRGDPGYASHLDRDDDGIACEN